VKISPPGRRPVVWIRRPPPLFQLRNAVALAGRSCVIVLVFLSHTLALDAPKAIFSETRFQFDRVVCGFVVEHDFVLKNMGSAPLRIEKVNMTSPLLITRMPREISPGQQGTIHFKLDTARLAGSFQGEISVFLNDSALSEVALSFEGQVVPTIELSPMPAFFVSAQRGQTNQSSIEIINHEPEPLRIVKVQHATDRFVTTLETLDAGQRYRITLALKPDGPAGRSSETILVKTSSKTLPILEIAANTYLHERVYTFPETIDLGAIPISVIRREPKVLEQMAQPLMIYQVSGSDFAVELSTDVPACSLRSQRGPQRDRYQATVSLIGNDVKVGPIRGSIFIQTNDPQFPKLAVPVSGWILER